MTDNVINRRIALEQARALAPLGATTSEILAIARSFLAFLNNTENT